MRKKLIFFLSLSQISIISYATTPLNSLHVGHGAILYDTTFPDGPSSKQKQIPGHWVTQLQNFNTGASSNNLITRLYPYSSELTINCPNTLSPQNEDDCYILDSGYDPETSGHGSAAAYRKQFPNAIIMPIIDWTPNEYNNYVLEGGTKYNISESLAEDFAKKAAQTIANNICTDGNVDGVFLDFEGVNTLGKAPLVSFYTQLSTLLHTTESCIDQKHPNGKSIAIYLSYKYVDWHKLENIFIQNTNSFIAIPIYDISDFQNPPSPDAITPYTTYATNTLSSAFQNASVLFTVIAPIAASFGTFQSYGSYTPSNNNLDFNYNYTPKADFSITNTPQLGYFQAVQAAVCANKSSYFLGIDYWSWQEYINPHDGYLRGPNLPDPKTVQFLQQSADNCPKK